MKASDFCSKPGITMDELRREAAQQVRLFAGYYKQAIEEAQAMGLTVLHTPIKVENIFLNQHPIKHY